MDLSTAILALAENGDLQRIHDKWLMKSSCALETAELESDRLHLKSFWGLFVICAIACFIALVIYFLQITHQLRNADPTPDSISSESNNARSRRLQRFLSLMDEKDDPSKRSKRVKVERSPPYDNNGDEESGRGRSSNRRQTELTSMNDDIS